MTLSPRRAMCRAHWRVATVLPTPGTPVTRARSRFRKPPSRMRSSGSYPVAKGVGAVSGPSRYKSVTTWKTVRGVSLPWSIDYSLWPGRSRRSHARRWSLGCIGRHLQQLDDVSVRVGQGGHAPSPVLDLRRSDEIDAGRLEAPVQIIEAFDNQVDHDSEGVAGRSSHLGMNGYDQPATLPVEIDEALPLRSYRQAEQGSVEGRQSRIPIVPRQPYHTI